MNIDVYTCPAAKIKAKPNNISIVVRVLWKKFVFNFDVGAVGWGAGWGAGFAGSVSENYVEVGYSIWDNNICNRYNL